MDEKQKVIEYNDYQRSRKDIIQWITERLYELPLGYIYQVRGYVRGFYESEER